MPCNVDAVKVRTFTQDNKLIGGEYLVVGSINISWQETNLSDQDLNIGHGLCIYSGRTRRLESLVAFIEGFAWRRGSDEAIVRFDRRFMPVDEKKFAAFKAAIEARLQAADISASELIPGYWCIANA